MQNINNNHKNNILKIIMDGVGSGVDRGCQEDLVISGSHAQFSSGVINNITIHSLAINGGDMASICALLSNGGIE